MKMGLFCSFVGGCITPLQSIIVGNIVGIFNPTYTKEQMRSELMDEIWFMIIVSVLTFLFSYAGYALMQISAERLSFRLRARYLSALLKQEIEFFERQQIEALPSKM